jgi:hypothetical protein
VCSLLWRLTVYLSVHEKHQSRQANRERAGSRPTVPDAHLDGCEEYGSKRVTNMERTQNKYYRIRCSHGDYCDSILRAPRSDRCILSVGEKWRHNRAPGRAAISAGESTCLMLTLDHDQGGVGPVSCTAAVPPFGREATRWATIPWD